MSCPVLLSRKSREDVIQKPETFSKNFSSQLLFVEDEGTPVKKHNEKALTYEQVGNYPKKSGIIFCLWRADRHREFPENPDFVYGRHEAFPQVGRDLS
jgi:hypothetical protein